MSFAYKKGGVQILIPEGGPTPPTPDHIYVPISGYGFVLAVEDREGNCIGWIRCSDLGFDTVQAYMVAHGQG